MTEVANNDPKYPLIQNPFVKMDSFVKPRLTLQKENIRMKGNTDYTQFLQYEDGIEIQNELDPKLNYFISNEIKEVNQIKEEFVPLDESMLDYSISAEQLNNLRTDGTTPHTEPIPMSFLNITTEEEGLLWYKKHYPKIPDDLLPIIARYHWGHKINKQTLKKEKKKNKKKTVPQQLVVKKAPDGESIKVDFN